ncbi:hypothetical protein FRX31_005000 [Thalictrum thalictroides]|uniref:Uncharacterized protein n=1 Tax=Thalictrum thalictroides TaxID=46969 RepID=A0A7J6X6U6_THATH|nr:hypothetical protein FRX31_005000 [Thalictrum thalictroides]
MDILEMESNMIPPVVAPPPPISHYNHSIVPVPNPQTLELVIQLLLKPEIANLLVAQGIVSPHIFNFFPKTIEPFIEVENHISPTLVMTDPYLND